MATQRMSRAMANEIFDGPTVLDKTGLVEGMVYDGRKVGYKSSETGETVAGQLPAHYMGVAIWSVKHQAYVLPEGRAGGRKEEKRGTKAKGTNVFHTKD